MKKKEKGKVNCFSYMGGGSPLHNRFLSNSRKQQQQQKVWLYFVTLGIRTYVTFLSLSLLGFDIVLLLNISCALFSFIQMHLVCVSVQVSRESGHLTTFQFEKKRSFFKQQQRSIDILSLWIIQSKFSIMHLYWHAGDRVSAFTSGTIEKKKKGIFMYYLKKKKEKETVSFFLPRNIHISSTPVCLLYSRNFICRYVDKTGRVLSTSPFIIRTTKNQISIFIFFFLCVCFCDDPSRICATSWLQDTSLWTNYSSRNNMYHTYLFI